MVVTFKTDKLLKQCNNQREMVKAFGERRAKILRRRLDDLRAAISLEDFRRLPGDCHEYRGQNRHSLTLDLDGGWRLFFEPHEPVPLLQDGNSLDWKAVKGVEITAAKDPHD